MPEERLRTGRSVRPGLIELFFGSSGRIGRFYLVGALAALLNLGVWFRTSAPIGIQAWVGGLVYFLLLYCLISVLAKRLHDLDRSGWWAGLLTMGVMWLWPQPVGLADMVVGGLLTLGLLALVILPGSGVWNRFGHPPA